MLSTNISQQLFISADVPGVDIMSSGEDVCSRSTAEKVGCWRTESRRLFQESGPEAEKARGPYELSLVRGVLSVRGSEAERRVREGL